MKLEQNFSTFGLSDEESSLLLDLHNIRYQETGSTGRYIIKCAKELSALRRIPKDEHERINQKLRSIELYLAATNLNLDQREEVIAQRVEVLTHVSQILDMDELISPLLNNDARAQEVVG